MRKFHENLRNRILGFVDFFYPPFRKIVPLETFRYGVCGGLNTCLDILIFFVCYNFVFQKRVVHFYFISIAPYIASFLIDFIITFPIGFYLNRYVVFQQASGRKRDQMSRYFTVVLGCLLLNYICLKILVGILHFYPTPSKIITTFVVIIFSYLTQKNFTFRTSRSIVGSEKS